MHATIYVVYFVASSNKADNGIKGDDITFCVRLHLAVYTLYLTGLWVNYTAKHIKGHREFVII